MTLPLWVFYWGRKKKNVETIYKIKTRETKQEYNVKAKDKLFCPYDGAMFHMLKTSVLQSRRIRWGEYLAVNILRLWLSLSFLSIEWACSGEDLKVNKLLIWIGPILNQLLREGLALNFKGLLTGREICQMYLIV